MYAATFGERSHIDKNPDFWEFDEYMGVSKNRNTPKWMVKIMETPIKMDDAGVPLFLETPIICWKGERFTVSKSPSTFHKQI